MWNAIKAGIMTGLEVMSKVPVSGIVKAGVFVGVAAFACWVMVKRTKKMHDAAHEDKGRRRSPVDEILGKSYVSDTDAYDDMDPVAKKLCRKLNRSWGGKGKKKKKTQKKAKRDVADDRVKIISVFDDEIGEDGDRKKHDFMYFSDADAMNQHMYPSKKKKSKKGKKGKKGSKKPTSILEELKHIGYEFKESGITDPHVARDRVDKIARELGLPVDDYDDNVSDDIRRSCSAIF